MKILLTEYARVMFREAIKPGVENMKAQIYMIKENRRLNRDRRLMERAIKQSIKRARAKRRTYYVLKDYDGRPFCANRKEIEVLQRGGWFKRKVTIFDLVNEASYISRPPAVNNKSNKN